MSTFGTMHSQWCLPPKKKRRRHFVVWIEVVIAFLSANLLLENLSLSVGIFLLTVT